VICYKFVTHLFYNSILSYALQAQKIAVKNLPNRRNPVFNSFSRPKD
jgi:hypothetical protein